MYWCRVSQCNSAICLASITAWSCVPDYSGSVSVPAMYLASILIMFSGSPRAHLHVVGMLWFMSFDTMSFDVNQASLPTPFSSALGVLFCLCGPFGCISFHEFSQLSAFSLCSFDLTSALSVLSSIYLFLKDFLNFSLRDRLFLFVFLYDSCLAARRS